MAKSKRSKVKRKFRAVKRHNIKPKAVELLKKVLNLPVGGTGLPYVDASKSAVVGVGHVEEVKSETKTGKMPSLMNGHGNYPIWMNKKEVKRQARKRRLIARQKKKVGKN